MKKILIFFILFSVSLFYFVKALSQNLQAGLPEDIKNYSRWTRLNRRILPPRSSDPHRGYKRVYINRKKNELIDSNKNLVFPYPEGTIVVKEVRESKKKNSRIALIATMRKLTGNETTGGWDFIEYTESSSDNSFIPINFPKESCYSCHQGASNSDAVWTKFDNF